MVRNYAAMWLGMFFCEEEYAPLSARATDVAVISSGQIRQIHRGSACCVTAAFKAKGHG